MIPKFPEFKKIELKDREEIEKITSNFLFYSSFNFTCMYLWNISNKIELSKLNDNLVVVFNDYISNDPFISFLGKNKINETVEELIKFSKEKYNNYRLRLISEETINLLEKDKFIINPDQDSYDYIYSVSNLANMNLWTQSSISKGIRRFIKENPNYVIKQSFIKDVKKEEYLEVFKKWANNKDIKDHFELNEYKAFTRLFDFHDEDIKIVSLYVDNVLIGFTVTEIISGEYALSHFIKADTKYHSAVYDILNWEEAKLLYNQGKKYYNWEEDLGIKGLKKSKLKYKPSFFLKLFTLSIKN